MSENMNINDESSKVKEKKDGGLVAVIVIFVIILVAAVFVGGIYFGKALGDKNNKGEITTKTSDSNANLLDSTIEEYAGIISDDNAEVEKVIADIKKQDTKHYDGNLNLVDGIPLIVFLGDSVYETNRDGETSVPNLIGARCGANVINLAMDSAPASISTDADPDNLNSYSHSGIGIANAMAGLYDVDKLDNSAAKAIIKENQEVFKQADVFVVEYGIYDYLQTSRIDNMDNLNDPASYQGALQRIIKAIKYIAPDATIVLMKPSICELKDESGNSYSRNIYGTLYDYAMKIECVDDPSACIEFYDTNIENGLNIYALDACLNEDGITLTEEGRRLYANLVGGFINRAIFGTEPPLE